MEKDEILRGIISKKNFEFNNVAKKEYINKILLNLGQIFHLKIALNL